MGRTQKVCPVLLRGSLPDRQILAFRHPLAGKQIVKGTVKPEEALEDAAIRELREESGVAAAAAGKIGSLAFDELCEDWHFVLCQADSLADECTHWTDDDGGHLFAFFWQSLTASPGGDWHPNFERALRYIGTLAV